MERNKSAEDLIKSILHHLNMADIVEEDLDDNIDHAELVAILVRLLCTQMELPLDFQHQVVMAAYLHDIGKLCLSKNLYGRDKNALQIEETRYMRMHANLGADMLEKCGFTPEICNAVHHHHENYDGSGYPDNLSGENIPWGARILRNCDVFAALVSKRPYRDAFDIDTAIELMIDEVKNFDMEVFLAFQKVVYGENHELIQKLIENNNRLELSERWVPIDFE